MTFQLTNHPQNNHPARYFFDWVMRHDPQQKVQVIPAHFENLNDEQRATFSKTLDVMENFLKQENAFDLYQEKQLEVFKGLDEELKSSTETKTMAHDLYEVTFEGKGHVGRMDRGCNWAAGGETSEDLSERAQVVFTKIENFRRTTVLHPTSEKSMWQLWKDNRNQQMENEEKLQPLLVQYDILSEKIQRMTLESQERGADPMQNPAFQALSKQKEQLGKELEPLMEQDQIFRKWEELGKQEREDQSQRLTGRSFEDHLPATLPPKLLQAINEENLRPLLVRYNNLSEWIQGMTVDSEERGADPMQDPLFQALSKQKKQLGEELGKQEREAQPQRLTGRSFEDHLPTTLSPSKPLEAIRGVKAEPQKMSTNSMPFKLTDHPQNQFPARYLFDLVMHGNPKLKTPVCADYYKNLKGEQRIALSKALDAIENFLSQDNAVELYQENQLRAFKGLDTGVGGSEANKTMGYDLCHVIFKGGAQAGWAERARSWKTSGKEKSEDLSAKAERVFANIEGFRGKIVQTPPVDSYWKYCIDNPLAYQENEKNLQQLLNEYNDLLHRIKVLETTKITSVCNSDQNPFLLNLQKKAKALQEQIGPLQALHDLIPQEQERQSLALTGRAFEAHNLE